MALIKRIKNVSGVSKQILNRDIAHNAYYEVPETMWQELANDVAVHDGISNATYIVNNGTSDLSVDDALEFISKFQAVYAHEVEFDNSTNGFESTEAQSAIEEIRAKLNARPGAPVMCGFDGTASTGRWLEFSGNVGGDDSGFIMPKSGVITHLSVDVNTNATCTFTVYKNATAVATLSISSASAGYNTQDVNLAAGDKITVKVTSGSGPRPVFNIFVRLDV